MQANTQANYTVWVGGVEVTDYLITEAQAKVIADSYIENGYTDVEIEQVK
jgi:hypothetical protein